MDQQKSRRDLFLRICKRCPALLAKFEANFERTWRVWGAEKGKTCGPAWGHMFLDTMLRLQRAAAAGDSGALQEFARSLERAIPRAEIVA